MVAGEPALTRPSPVTRPIQRGMKAVFTWPPPRTMSQ
jgi:hypothetical protein